MDIDRLREFEALARTLNFHAAAAELFESQSTLSKHLAALEAEMGVTLFERQPMVVLTPAGSFFHHSIEPLLADMENRLNEIIEKTRSIEETHIELCVPNCCHTIDKYHFRIRSMRDSFNQEFAPLVLQTRYQKWGPPFPDAFSGFLTDGVDCSFLFTALDTTLEELQSLYPDLNCDFKRIGSQEYFLIVGADSKLGRQEVIRPEDLARIPLYGDGAHAIARSKSESFVQAFKRGAGVNLSPFEILPAHDIAEGYLSVELGDGGFFSCDAELATGNFSGQDRLVKRRIEGFPVVLDYWCFWEKDSLTDLQIEAINLMGA